MNDLFTEGACTYIVHQMPTIEQIDGHSDQISEQGNPVPLANNLPISYQKGKKIPNARQEEETTALSAPTMPTWLVDAPHFDEFPIDESTYHNDAMPHDIGQDLHPIPLTQEKQRQEPKEEKGRAAITYTYENFVGAQIVDFLDQQGGNAFIVNPDTGHGKTTAIELSARRAVLAMPMQAQCQQRQAKGSSFAVYEGVSTKDAPPDWQNIATTYNSLPRVLAVLQPEILAIDEIHHFMTDSYRQSAIRDAYDAIKRFDGQKILMSATPLADILTQTIFPEFKLVDCRDVGTARPARNIPIIAMDGGIVDHALHIARTGMINGASFPNNGVIICHLNDKITIEAAIDHINKTSSLGRAYGFTAGTKEESHHEMMIKDGKLPDDCRFLFTTSLINDAFSFGARPNVVLVSRKSSLLPHECVQLCARWRDGLDMALPHALIIFKRESDKKPVNLAHNGLIFSEAVVKEYKRLLDIAQLDLECAIAQRAILNKRLNTCADGGETAHVQKLIEKINAAYTNLIFRKDEIEIDRIAILQAATEANRHMTTGQLIREIEEYDGFSFAGLDASQQDETERVKEAAILLKSEEKATKAEQFANVLEVARQQGVDLLKGIIDSIKQYPDLYPDGTIEGCRSVVSLWRLVEKQDGDFGKLLDTMAEREITSKNKANKLANRIRTAQVLANEAELAALASDGHASAAAIKALGDLLPSGVALTSDKVAEVREAMQGIDGSEMIGRWGDKSKAIKSVRALFECKRQQKRDDEGKRVNFWRVDGVFDLASIRKSVISQTPESEKVRHEQKRMI